jgi:hypothetical protein
MRWYFAVSQSVPILLHTKHYLTKYRNMYLIGGYNFIPYIEFCKEIQITNQREHIGVYTTHSKANVTLMSVKIKIPRSDVRKLPGYDISEYHCH